MPSASVWRLSSISSSGDSAQRRITSQMDTSALGGKMDCASSVISSSTKWVWCLTISQPARCAAVTMALATSRLPPWLMPISATTSGECSGPMSRWAIFMTRSLV